MTMLAKITLVHKYNGVTVENTFGLETGDGTDPQDLADAVAATLTGSAWLTGRSDQISLVEVRAEDDTPGTAGSGSHLFTAPETGDDTGNGSPPLTALVVKWRALGKGKAGRGRMYLAGYPASTAVAGFWTADAQDPASAAASVIFDAYGPDGSGQLCIINRFSGGTELSPHVGNLIKSFTIDNVIRRQGRREVDRGI
jgi:hypothetical protein